MLSNIRIQTRQTIRVQSCGKRKLYSIREVNANFIWRKFQETHHGEPLGQQRRFVERGVFEKEDSKTAKTAEETSILTKTPDFEYHSEPLRQHRRFVASGDFEEKDSKRKIDPIDPNRKIDPIAQQNLKTILRFSY